MRMSNRSYIVLQRSYAVQEPYAGKGIVKGMLTVRHPGVSFNIWYHHEKVSYEVKQCVQNEKGYWDSITIEWEKQSDRSKKLRDVCCIHI